MISGFDGVDPVTLFTSRAGSAIELYREGMGFSIIEQLTMPADPWRELWELPPGDDLAVTLLAKPNAHGGGIRVVQVPELPTGHTGRIPNQPGPYAWDFYVRDIHSTVARIEALGWSFRSAPQVYQLFGQNFDVTECMLEGPDGLLHALVEYIPNRHRCVLGVDPQEEVSEVIALVVVVRDLPGALQAMVSGLDADVAMDEVFSGAAIEQLLDLAPGTRFRMTLMRGPSRRSARFELLEQVAGSPEQPSSPRVLAPMPVADVASAAESLRSYGCAVKGPVTTEHGEVAIATLAPGVTLELRSSAADQAV